MGRALSTLSGIENRVCSPRHKIGELVPEKAEAIYVDEMEQKKVFHFLRMKSSLALLALSLAVVAVADAAAKKGSGEGRNGKLRECSRGCQRAKKVSQNEKSKSGP